MTGRGRARSRPPPRTQPFRRARAPAENARQRARRPSRGPNARVFTTRAERNLSQRLRYVSAPPLTADERFNVAAYFSRPGRLDRALWERQVHEQVNEAYYRVPQLQPAHLTGLSSLSHVIQAPDLFSRSAGAAMLDSLRQHPQARAAFIDRRPLTIAGLNAQLSNPNAEELDARARLLHGVFALAEETWTMVNVHELWGAAMAGALEIVPPAGLNQRMTMQLSLISADIDAPDDEQRHYQSVWKLNAVSGNGIEELALAMFGSLLSRLGTSVQREQEAEEGSSDRRLLTVEYKAIQVAVLMHDYRGGQLSEPWLTLVRPPNPPIRTVEVAGCICLLKEPSKPYYCLLEALNLLDDGATIPWLEEKLGIQGELTREISFVSLHKIALERGWRLFLYESSSPANNAKCVGELGKVNAFKCMHLLLMDHHYFPILSRSLKKMCVHCGDRFLASHACTRSGPGYYARVVKKQKVKNIELSSAVMDVHDGIWEKWCNDYDQTYCFYDLETAEFEGSALFTVYHVGALFVYKDDVGALESVYKSWYGANDHELLKGFMSEVMAVSRERRHPVRLVSHNGARFDAFFLTRWYLEYALLTQGTEDPWPLIGQRATKSLGIHVGALKTLRAVDEDGVYGFLHFDMYLHLARSLDALAKTFLGEGANTEGKDYFPHSFLKGKKAEEVLAYRGERPPLEHFQRRAGPPVTEEMLDEAGLSRTDFDLRALSERYLRQDVELTFRVFKAYATGVSEQFGRPATEWGLVSNNITLSQMTYRCWLRFLACEREEMAKQIICPKGRTYDIIMQAMYGGRVYPSILQHEVPLGSERWVQADICSMYPSAMMSEQFPLGVPQELDEMKMNEFNDLMESYQLEDLERVLPLGIYWCKVDPNPYLTEPVIPHRPMVHGKKQGLRWTLEVRDQYLTSVDMITALRCGYRIKILAEYTSIIWMRQGNMFKGYVDELFKLKKKATVEKNPVKRELAKLMMNALYGKLLQSAVYPEVHAVPIAEAGEYLQAIVDKGESSWVGTNAGTSYLFLTITPNRATALFSYPTQLGVFTLAHSRRIFVNFLRTASPDYDRLCRWRPGRVDPRGPVLLPTLAYNDTDSGLIPESYWYNLVHAGMVGDELGNGETAYVSNDLGENARVLGWVAPAPKTYILRVQKGQESSYKVRMKGIHVSPEKVADPFYVKNVYDHMKRFINDPSIRPPELSFDFGAFHRTLNRVPRTEAARDMSQSMAFTIYTTQITRALRKVHKGRLLTPTEDYPFMTMPRRKTAEEEEDDLVQSVLGPDA